MEKDIRTRTNEALAKYNIKQIDLAKETNVHHSTLSLWLQGKVKGTQIKIEDQMEKWLNSLNQVKTKPSKAANRLQLLKGKREKHPNFDNITEKNPFGSLVPISIHVELEGKNLRKFFSGTLMKLIFSLRRL